MAFVVPALAAIGGGSAAAGAVTAIGTGVAVAGAVGQAKAAKANKSAVAQANLTEANRRQQAAEELKKATDQYNQIRSQRPDLTVEQYISERLGSLTGPDAEQAREAFQQIRQEDFQAAQTLADEASIGNVDAFKVILDDLSGGDSLKILQSRNENALGTNEQDAFARALELRSTAIPAGTSRLNEQGQFVEGQRSDKQAFQFAFETQEALRDKQFGKLNSILENDRAIAARQQEKALSFLDNTNFTAFSNALADQNRQQREIFQAQDEQTQLNQIASFQNAAFTDKTQQPVQQDLSSYGQLTQGGFDLALKGLSQGFGNNSK